VLSLRTKHAKQLAAIRRAAELKAAQRASALPAPASSAHLPAPHDEGLDALPAVDYRTKALELASRDPATASLVLKAWLAEGTDAAGLPVPAKA
jgi:hypothetical protein